MSETKLCDTCGEEVLAVARKCRWCGEFFDAGLRAERRRTAQRDQGWALPLVVPLMLGVQGLVLLPLSLLCGVHRAEEPVLTGLGFLIAGAALFAVTSATRFAMGCRFRLLLVAAGNLLGIGLGTLAINALNISPGPPSPLLASLGIGLSLASLGLATFVILRRSQRAREEGVTGEV